MTSIPIVVLSAAAALLMSTTSESRPLTKAIGTRAAYLLDYGSYLGGAGDELAYLSVVVDDSGYIYLAGRTNSIDFPNRKALQPVNAGGYDAFVTKLSPAGDSLIYSTYLGGGGDDFCRGLAVDRLGCAYLAGTTFSSDFPTKNAFQGTLQGGQADDFVVKLSPGGDSLIYSTYLGGTGVEDDGRIAVDSFGCAYVTGITRSLDFPILNACDTSHNGGDDVFVTKFSPDGGSLVFSTYLGGNVDDGPLGIAVDDSGCTYVTGSTLSTNFPVVNPYHDHSNGNWDCFVTKFSADGGSLIYSTYVGGNYSDGGHCIAVDRFGCAHIAGGTNSANLPTPNAFDNTFSGIWDGWVFKLSHDGGSLEYSSYLGGSGTDVGCAIAADDSGHALVVGETDSPDFPRVNAYDDTLNGGLDFFVVKVDSTGRSIEYSTFLGGSGDDEGYGAVLGPSGCIYASGYGNSPDFPTARAFDSSFNGGTDIVVLRLCPEPPPQYVCGDANADAAVDISDAVYLIAYIFGGGPAPNPLAAGDANCDQTVDISDAVYLISYIFGGGPAPCDGCK